MRKRLDDVLVTRGLVPSRSRARDAIARGLVECAGVAAKKAGQLVEVDVQLVVNPAAGTDYVSRGALKLAAALDTFNLDAYDAVALDIGASTGGFTQVLLERGVRRVYAVDVGTAQLHSAIKSDPRVVSHEGTDARALTTVQFEEPVSALVIDVSFISLLKVLPSLAPFLGPGAWCVALIKPQFEVGRDGIGKGGVVRNEALREKVVQDVRTFMRDEMGWSVLGVIPSPIEGGSGNTEYLIGARTHG
jgi:23S rRNA (cytidine1920-2'-O)/16S rRNA (cytidine1409-2'-O)-methyltransferase